MHDWDYGFSIGLKYKYKPFDKYDIRLLGEIGTAFSPEGYKEGLSILPIMAGINYEYRFTEATSIWGDLGLGISIPLSDRRKDWGDHWYYHSFEPGFAFSPEIGIKYNDFSYSFKFIYSMNECVERHIWSDGDIYDYDGYIYDSFYFFFQLGYHF